MTTTVGNKTVSPKRASGFTLLEVIVVLLIGSVALGITAATFRDFQESTTARRAAEVFVRDLGTARGAALRQRQPVAVAFSVDDRIYRVRSGDQLFVTRDLSTDGEITLSAITMDLPGDSVIFTGRGIADFSEAGEPVVEASFRAGSTTYVVSFNALAAAEVARLD